MDGMSSGGRERAYSIDGSAKLRVRSHLSVFAPHDFTTSTVSNVEHQFPQEAIQKTIGN